METHKTKLSRSTLIAICAGGAIVLAVVLWIASYLHSVPLSSYLRKDMPTLALDLSFKDVKGKPVPAENTRLAGGTVKEEKTGAQPEAEKCPELIGGDTSQRSTPSDFKKVPKECTRSAKWVVKRHPIAFSLYIRDGDKVAAWLEKEGGEGGILRTKFFSGLFHDLQHTASIRAEDLQIEGVQGAFLRRLVLESLRADAVLHYDISHGEKGFVFSFVRGKCPFSAKVLPVICGVLARSAYTVPKLKEPVLEMRIGLQRFFVTQSNERVYFSNGLEALLNVLENASPPPSNQPQTPLVLTLRAEAFLDRFLPVLTSAPSFEVTAGFRLSEDNDPGLIGFKGGKFARHLRPKVFPGVFAGIPHDAFAALVTSFHLPPKMDEDSWVRLASTGPEEEISPSPEEGGVALIWDLEHLQEGISSMGVVIANQTSADEVESFAKYFSDQDLTSECGGGTVFLAATSQALLTRMREGCTRQSLNVLDWEHGARRGEYENAQLMTFINPGVAMRELSLAGVGENQKQEYEEAREAMQKEAEKGFRSLPIFAYAGSAGQAGVVQLKGFTVNQGAAQ